MSNKYLEKIAIIKPLWRTAKATSGAIGSIGKDVAKDVGHSVMTAGGSGFRDAAKKLNPKISQKNLRAVGSAGEFAKANRKNFANKAELHKAVRGLQAEKNKGIVKSVGYTGAAYYGGNKILDKINQNNNSQYPQYY